MARIVTTARGEQVDFDALLIKQQLAQAPMNIEVERRKKFIDSKEGKLPKPLMVPAAAPAPVEVPAVQAAVAPVSAPSTPDSFELDNEPLPPTKAIKK